MPRMSPGIEIRRELNALEIEVQQLRQRLDQRRLADARHAFQQQMAAAEDGHQHQTVQFRTAQQLTIELFAQLRHQLDGRSERFRLQQGGRRFVGHSFNN